VWWASFLAVLVQVALPAHAIGSGEHYGHDTISQGLAQAVVATDSGPAAAFVNPAALGRVRSPQLHTGVQLSLPFTEIALDNPRAGDDPLAPAVATPVSGLAVGFATPVSLLVEDRLFVGFSAYLPQQVLLRARSHDPARPFFHVYDSTTEHYELFASLGVRVFDWLFAGVGSRLGAGQGGSTDIIIDPVQGRFVRQSLDTSQTSVPSTIVGVLVGPLGVDGVVTGRLGLVMRDRSSFDVELPAALTVAGLDVGLELALLSLSSFSPRTWTGGLAVDLWEQVQLTLDVQLAQWSEAPPPFLRVRNTVQGEGLAQLGLEGALDAPQAGQERVVSPGFVDTVNVRGGVSWWILPERLVWRAGYGFRPTPVPDQTSGSNIADNTTHIVATGAGLRFSLPGVAEKPFLLNAAWQAHILSPRTAAKANPRDPVGGWTASGVVHQLSLDVRYAW
jgi:hypothetical protein